MPATETKHKHVKSVGVGMRSYSEQRAVCRTGHNI